MWLPRRWRSGRSDQWWLLLGAGSGVFLDSRRDPRGTGFQNCLPSERFGGYGLLQNVFSFDTLSPYSK